MTRSRIGNTELISDLNNRLVLQAVRVAQPTFRAEVSRQTGLKPATVTSIVNSLIERQLLRETASPLPADTTGQRFGRPPLMLEINRDGKRILAIDLEPDHIRVGLADLLADMQVYREQPIDRFDNPDVILREVLQLCRTVLGTFPRKNLLGVGVSLPGLIDRQNGILLSSTNMPKWRNVPVATILQKELRAPVRVERAVHLAALYEMWSHPEHQNRKVLVISLRTGIGASLLLDGQLYVGAHGLDGEIGHTIVDINGRDCDCGSRGCLETFVGAPAIVARARALIADGKAKSLSDRTRGGTVNMPEALYELAREGDADCAHLVRDVGRYIGIAVANLINLLGPNEVVICGAIDAAEELILRAIREQVNQSALPRMRDGVVVRAAAEREKLPLLGAAVLIAQDLFELPELRHAEMPVASA
jgi:predicted NBD/HSP70 family sugar kinase